LDVGYVDESYIQYGYGLVPSGTIEQHSINSNELGYEKTLFTYLPPVRLSDYSSFPVLVVLDGEESLSIGKFNQIVDNLIFAKKIPPIVMVFVKPTNRHLEYINNERYIQFITKEVRTFSENFAKKHSIQLSASLSQRAIIGASLGGLFTTNLVLQEPKSFGVCIAQSPSYWWNKGEIYKSPYLPNASEISFILHTGTVCDAKELTFFMKSRLMQNRAKKIVYREFAQGHTWGNWKSNFATAVLDWISN
jgi:enterochelin esterase-like enzyme